ncbi:MAG: zf-TFIIB domain-containing protein [Planctomycetota bacterium]|jgi:Zn-finger nucleic acid-binding protein
MNCPSCGKLLAQAEYEGLPVWHCEACKGRLAGGGRVEAIKEKYGLSTDELVEEVQDERRGDIAGPANCPRCAKPMKKEAGPGPVPFDMDSCDTCKLVWFDGGELALLQLAHEAAKEDEMSEELTRQVEDLSPGSRKSFDDKLSALRDGLVPDGPDLADYGFMTSVFGDDPVM